jgi:hypothetical protein
MASSIFYQFHVNNCIVDSELLDHFRKAGWGLEVNDDQFFTKYKWPDIILSKKIIDDDSIDALGCYRTYKDFKKEGSIVLYHDKILKTATDYKVAKSSSQSLEKIVQYLTTIVLVHEFVHWLMHFVHPGTKLPFKRVKVKYQKLDEKEFHECFAQLFTFHFVNKKGGLYKDIFDWLEVRQPNQYTVYHQLLDKGLKRSDSIVLLKLLKVLDIQSFGTVIKLLEDRKIYNKRIMESAINLLEVVQSQSLKKQLFVREYLSDLFIDFQRNPINIKKLDRLINRLSLTQKELLARYFLAKNRPFFTKYLEDKLKANLFSKAVKDVLGLRGISINFILNNHLKYDYLYNI